MDIRPIDANALIEKLDNINPVDYGAMSSYETHNGAREALSDAVMHVNDAPTLSLNTLRDAIYQDAVAHGLWEKTDDPIGCSFLVSKEATELVNAGNEVQLARWRFSVDETEAWGNYVDELADVIIDSLYVAGKLGIDIDAAIRRKMEINKGRPWKHGKE